jgi:predicted  nucleic acid-binding Zn ribbon protein
MFIQRVKIKIKSKVDKEELVDDFGLLMAFYRTSGQTQGKIESQYINKDTIVCYPFTLEKNALNEKYNNEHVNKNIRKIEKKCQSKLKLKTVGKSYAHYKSPCTCKKSAFYILMTNYVTIQSPVKCGTCYYPVPLYRIPKYEDDGYCSILSWETDYVSCDSLQMNCSVGEKWALNQMEKATSALTKQGLTICQKVEAITSIPMYYYLHNYSKIPTKEHCPICKGDWALKEKLHDFFDYKCDTCKLVSTLSFNSQ